MRGLVLAAPRSGSGKTLVTLGLIGALRARGLEVAPAKSGPDYIDGALLGRAAGRPTLNLDAWAMAPARLAARAAAHSQNADLLLVEGAMGLFDAAADGRGSTADLAQALDLPVVLVVDAEGQGQSLAAVVSGFAHYRTRPQLAGVIVNRVAGERHAQMLRSALAPLDLKLLGLLPRRADLGLPARHLGLVLPEAMPDFDELAARAARWAGAHVDLDALAALAVPLPRGEATTGLAPLGQRLAIARDEAFAFVYPHLLADWRAAGAELHFFSPLDDEAPAADADAVFLPGGYPELHAARLAAARNFHQGLTAAAARGTLIYGECGGYMVLGQALTDAKGDTHAMTGLLPIATDISRPRLTLGYRRLVHDGSLPWPRALLGHEFHYSTGGGGKTPLFTATDALNAPLPAMGAVVGRTLGSYAHVIDGAAP